MDEYQFKRWKIIDESRAILKTSKTFFDHAVAEINDEIEDFLITRPLKYGKKLDVTLIFDIDEYPGYVKILKSGRVRLYFRKGPLKDKFRLLFPQYAQNEFEFPRVELRRISEDRYLVSFIEHDDFGEISALDRVTVEPGTEGKSSKRYAKIYERNPRLRDVAKQIHGTHCSVCGFDFFKTYGELGRNFIEVHHICPISQRGEDKVDPKTDLICVCSNCHSMLHRVEDKVLTVEELREIINH